MSVHFDRRVSNITVIVTGLRRMELLDDRDIERAKKKRKKGTFFLSPLSAMQNGRPPNKRCCPRQKQLHPSPTHAPTHPNIW